MARRSPPGRVVRRSDSIGRTYYLDRSTGRRVDKRTWTLERERVAQKPPKAPQTPRGTPAKPSSGGGGRWGGGGGGGGGGGWDDVGGGGGDRGPRVPDVEPIPHKPAQDPFPTGVREPGVPDMEFEDMDWGEFAVDGEEDYEEI